MTSLHPLTDRVKSQEQTGATPGKRLGEEQGQTPLTKKDWLAATPRMKGYISYYQAAWNPAIPDKNPYPKGSARWNLFQRGAVQAAIEVQEGDDE